MLTDALSVSLAVAAFIAGTTGTWSPCGFSMIETIGPTGHDGGRATTLAACVAFTLGALAGGVATFATLAAAGALLQGAGDDVAYLAAAVLATGAAVIEIRGARILPQVRRQLPEHWRRLMPMPVAAGLYGVLLGLGFTTFVLTFGVFALAAVAFAVADPSVGVAIGLGFGLGRALPVSLIAPVADREVGVRISETMAERPSIYRAFRVGDGFALLAVALALALAIPAGAAKNVARPAADPSVAGKALVFERPDGTAVLRRGPDERALPGHDPAIGDGYVAVIDADRISILSAADLEPRGSFAAPGADAVAISGHWIVWRSRAGERDALHARRIDDLANPGPIRSLGRSGRRGQFGRPSLDGHRLVYARSSPEANLIVRRVLGAKRSKRAKATLMRSRVDALQNPSINGGHLLYVRVSGRGSRLMLARVGGGEGRVLFRIRRATLWSTALGPKLAYVTVLHGGEPRARIVSVAR